MNSHSELYIMLLNKDNKNRRTNILAIFITFKKFAKNHINFFYSK